MFIESNMQTLVYIHVPLDQTILNIAQQLEEEYIWEFVMIEDIEKQIGPTPESNSILKSFLVCVASQNNQD